MSGHFRLPTILLGACLAAFLAGCGEQPGKDIAQAQRPFDGKLLQHAGDGRLIQETRWDHGRLMACWEWRQESHWVEGKLIQTPPRWTQTVTAGYGKRTIYDADAKPLGQELYENGLYASSTP
jgi:hypothetical protein